MRIGLGRPPRLAATLGALDGMLAHQPLHLTARSALPSASERLPGPPVAIGLVVGFVDLADPLHQPLILNRSSRRWRLPAVVIGGSRHVQGPADRLDAEAITMRINKRGHFGRSASSSVAKNTLAALRISFARRNSKFSRFRRLISSRSSVVGRSGRKP